MRDPVCRLLRQHAPVNLSTKDQFSTQHKTRKHRLIFTEILLLSSASFVIWEPAAYLDRVLLESSLAMDSSASLFVRKHAQRTIALRVVPSNMTTSYVPVHEVRAMVTAKKLQQTPSALGIPSPCFPWKYAVHETST